MKGTMQDDWNELDKAIKELYEPVVKPFVDWVEKWAVSLVSYLKRSISMESEQYKSEGEIATVLKKITETKTEELKKLKEMQKGGDRNGKSKHK